MILPLILTISLIKSLLLPFLFLFSRNDFLPDDLFLELNLEILNIVDTLDQFLETALPAPEVLLDLLPVLLHPTHQLLLLPRCLLRLLLPVQLSVQGLSVAEVLIVDVFSQLGCCFHRRYGDLPAVDVLDSG